MKLPRGDLVASRVVDDPGTALLDALDDALAGYLVLEPGSTLLLGDDDAGVLTLTDGVPVLAYHTGRECGGAEALAALATPGPLRVDRHVVPRAELDAIHARDGREALAVAPSEPARVLAGDHGLASRTDERAPADHPGRETDDDADPLAAFLDDADQIAALREDARAEAKRRAADWGFTDELE